MVYRLINVSYSKWKALKSGLTLTAYYLQYDFQYNPFLVDKTNEFVYQTQVMRINPNAAPDPNLSDFETMIKPGATLELTIANGIADTLA